ncbi:hypothetical protein [Eisenibacter elegans]|jgi:hypothetical protein|uniref:hypothetical protein n=1 Tax=Eisenibacter elegans TaxID=997 RepID=UPI000415DE98|nr:hypothetical protein [Eisenibacter elegans]
MKSINTLLQRIWRPRHHTAPQTTKETLRLSVQEMRLVSLALLSYQQRLNYEGQHPQAKRVDKLDQKFYALLCALDKD